VPHDRRPDPGEPPTRSVHFPTMAASPPTDAEQPAGPTSPRDLTIGAFSDDPPWLVDPEAMPWREAVDGVRWITRAQLPELIRPRRLPRGRRVFTVVRHLGTALGPWYLFDRRKGREASRAGLSRRLRVAAEHLGPTYIKLGQIISSGEGLFPEELVTEFKKCRDQVPPQPFSDVRTIVEADFGRPLEDVFSSFDRTPLAAASIAQVHAATLRTGEQVVVKVQRRTVGERVHADLEVMAWLAPFLVGRIPIAALANPPALVELFAETITEELDFRLEAQNMLDVAASFVELGQRGYVVPRPHPELVTPRVLVMERLDGFNFDDVTAMKDAGVDTHAVVRTGMIGFMEGALICGIFHGDLHGGNLFVLPDGRTALLDFGITGRMGEKQRLAFLRLLLGATTNDVRTQLAALRDLGALPPDTDLEQVIVDLDLEGPPIDPTSLTPDEMIHEIQRVVKLLLGYGARMPKELMLYVKNLVFLDGAIARLAPELDLFAEIAAIAMHFTQTHGERIFADIGVDAASVEFDFSGVKAGFGVDPGLEGLTYQELRERRELIRTRFEKRGVR
jgi:ubiquinone biosynthesis protein